MFTYIKAFILKVKSKLFPQDVEDQSQEIALPSQSGQLIIAPSPQVLSFIRFIRHKHNPQKKLGGLILKGEPQHNGNLKLPCTLIKNENTKIRTVLLKLCGDGNGPYIISPVIDHWTTASNLKKIVNSGAFYGNAILKQHGVSFNENALTGADILNLDGNVICFCPGGYVDRQALQGEDRIRLRIDLRKAKLKGKFNTFFKITDLCVEPYTVTVHLTEELSVRFSKFGARSHFFNIEFRFKEIKWQIPFKKNELIFYGDLIAINRFCLLMFFIALEKSKKEGFENVASEIYDYLNKKDENELRKILTCFAQNMTMYSELNINCMLTLTPHLIYDMHFAKENKTFAFYDLPPENYANAIKNIGDGMSFDHTLSTKNEVIKSIHTNRIISLYGVPLSAEYVIDAKAISNDLFNEEKGYVETRIGKREVPAIKYSESNSFSILQPSRLRT